MVGRPVPVRVEMSVGSAVLELVTVSVPVREPFVSGAKMTEMTQLIPEARVLPHVLVWVKLPVRLITSTLRAMALVLVRVKALAVEVPPPA